MEPTAKLRGLTWLEVEVKVPSGLTSELEILLSDLHLGGWVVEGEEPDLVWVVYLPCASGWEFRMRELDTLLNRLGAEHSVRQSIVDEDWANCWKQFYHPTKYGQHIVICPSWEHYQAQAGEKVIVLDPGMAFGTGYHASTAMCLELVQTCVLEHEPQSVLDVGTGSGILSLAAVAMGAHHVLATDFDPVAVQACQDNVFVNNRDAQIEVREYTGVAQGTFDLVLANLVARLLCQLATELAAALNPQGRLIASGIVEERRDEVVEAFTQAGMVVEKEVHRDTWVSLQLKK